ncbi:MAG TPA: septal ring lytic transglycosylase RlpA family protein [Rhodocyclaceae bacterium]|nr:septal ring lytic transglycosylase RlpA family protein [Rhodocyclaceae bacterium]
MKGLAILGVVGLLAACGTQPPSVSSAPTFKAAPKKAGGYYKDDGPGGGSPTPPESVPDAEPKVEPLHRFANNPYSVLGQDYVPMKQWAPYKARGIGSWYGRKFHGQPTSSGEPYDMYAMTAAHPTLPIPSYVRVGNPANGKSVVVRVNDRGPFHSGRLIDLSWTAAYKLGYVDAGSAPVEVELLLPGQTTTTAAVVASAPGSVVSPVRSARVLAETQEGVGHYLQLGAFSSRDNAQVFHSRLTGALGDLAEKLVVRSTGKLFRVQLGPWSDRAEAQRISAQVGESLGMPAFIVQ